MMADRIFNHGRGDWYPSHNEVLIMFVLVVGAT